MSEQKSEKITKEILEKKIEKVKKEKRRWDSGIRIFMILALVFLPLLGFFLFRLELLNLEAQAIVSVKQTLAAPANNTEKADIFAAKTESTGNQKNETIEPTTLPAKQMNTSSSPEEKNSSLHSLGITTRVSISSEEIQGDYSSDYSSVSSDGRYVAFESSSSNLVNGDTNTYRDIFVYDRQTGGTTRISVSSAGIQSNFVSDYSSINADGRYVAFESDSSNLVSGDTNGSTDAFIHDRQTGETIRVSVSSTGIQGNGASGISWPSSISADGRYVVFESNATNLVSGDTNGKMDVFIHDRQTGENTRVSVSSEGTQGNYNSDEPSISADGRFAAFVSVADNLISEDFNEWRDVFVHDLQTGEATRASVSSEGIEGNHISDKPSISADGRYVAFVSIADNLVIGDSDNYEDIFVHDRQTGETSLVSVSSTGTQGNSREFDPSISADGRYVVFSSFFLPTLVSEDNNYAEDIFIHDRQTGETTRVSVSSEGIQGNHVSVQPSISADGRYVVFTSFASNLISGDTNNTYDVFVHDRGEVEATYNISGSIKDKLGNAIQDVSVSLTTTTGEDVTSVTNASDGSYTFPDIPSGIYLIYANKTDYQFTPYPLTVTLNTDRTGQNILGEEVCPPSLPQSKSTTSYPMCEFEQGFLKLPFKRDINFEIAALAAEGSHPGLVTAWVDHDLLQNQVRTWSMAKMKVGTELDPVDAYQCDPPRSDCYDHHEGTDFDLELNELVYPAAPGVVVETCPPTCNRGYGRFVLIDHENGYATLYGHLLHPLPDFSKNPRFTKEDILSRPIGKTGASCGSDLNNIIDNCFGPKGDHLHFSVLFDEYYNYELLKGSWTSIIGTTAQDEVDPYGPAKPDDPWDKTNIYLWKEQLDVKQKCTVSTDLQIYKFSGLTFIFPPSFLCTDAVVTIGTKPVPQSIPESLKNISLPYFMDFMELFQITPLMAGAQKGLNDLSAPVSIVIDYDPESLSPFH